MINVKIDNAGRIIPANILIPKGSGPHPAIVMNHGHGGSKEEHGGFVKLAKHFAQRGIATISLDFPGCGESTENFKENYLSSMVSDSNASLKYILDNYEIDKEKLGILGFSMGAVVALKIVNEQDSPYKSVGLLAPPIEGIEEIMMRFVGGEDEFKRLLEEAKSEKGYAHFENPFGNDQTISIRWFEELEEFKKLNIIENIEEDILVIHGGEDTLVTPSMIKSALAFNPHVEKIFIPQADHIFGFREESSEITDNVSQSFGDFFEKSFKK